ncbi:MAG TPA: exo-alpha-sialidase [Saprospiraceae bacterium]|nr:exo-alpha-sialidase [Saprospiraceae bacterium]HMQ82268.1 exo-alpha-sialidase [Saprospiraceae bacterium]
MSRYQLILLLTLNAYWLWAQEAATFREIPLFQNSTSGYACFRIPAIVKAPSGDLLAFAEGRKENCADFGDVDIVLRVSQDGGLNWTPLQVVVENGTLQAGNPCPVVDTFDPAYPEGRVLLFYNTGDQPEAEIRQGKGVRKVWFLALTGNDYRAGQPVDITTWVKLPEWRSYANGPGHALQITQGPHQGRLIIPANHSFGDPQDQFKEYRTHAFYSDDHGKSWQLGQSLDIPGSNEAMLVQRSDDKLLLIARDQAGIAHRKICALSSDGGASWDTTWFQAQLVSPICQSSMLSVQTPLEKQVLLYANPFHESTRKNMSLQISLDNGQNWMMARSIRAGDSAYSDLVQTQEGTIGLLYEHGNEGGIHFTLFNWKWLVAGLDVAAYPWLDKWLHDDWAIGKSFRLASPKIVFDNSLFEQTAKVSIPFQLGGASIHYTLDSTPPNQESPLYSNPLEIDKTCILKAAVFHDCCQPSPIASAEFVQLPIAPSPEKYELSTAPAPQYAGMGGKTAWNKARGTSDFRSEQWLGFTGDAVWEWEYTKAEKIGNIWISALSDPDSWIFPPKGIRVWTSKNGQNYQLAGEWDFSTISSDAFSSHSFYKITADLPKSKYWKLEIRSAGPIPEWHPGKGTPAWLFVDEILAF